MPTVNTTVSLPVPTHYFCKYNYTPTGTSGDDGVGVASMAVWRLNFDEVKSIVQRLVEVLSAVAHVKVDEKHEHQQ